MHINIAANLNMQQLRSNREAFHEPIIREGSFGESPIAAGRTEISTLVNDYTHSQRHCTDISFSFFE